MLEVVGDRSATDSQALALARAETGKWVFAVAAAVGIGALLRRRPPAGRVRG